MLWEQIADGSLTSEAVPRSIVPATNPRYEGAISRMLIHRDASGRHVCTTHQIVDGEGNVLHWDASDVKLPAETVAKAHRKR